MKYICGLDIGSSKIAICLGSFRAKGLDRLWWDSSAALGVKYGQWQDISSLTAAISQLMKNIKTKSGIKVRSVYLGIVSRNIAIKHSQAVIALAERGNRSVSKTDIQNVNHQAHILGSDLEYEILHAEPLNYIVDNETEVVDPLGLYGHQLKANLYLISARTSYTNTIIEVINRLGLKLNDITLSGLATSQAIFNPEKSKGLNILCDVGKDITQIIIFNDGRLIHYQVINYGGDDLTTSLAKELSLPYSLAEEVKISHGRLQNDYRNLMIQSESHSNQKSKRKSSDKEIIIKKADNYATLSQNLVIQILSQVSTRFAQTIRDVIQPHLSEISSYQAPDKITLHVSGRTACLEGFLELLEVVVGVTVKMAKVDNSSLLVPLMKQRILSGEPVLKYLSCLGLIAKAIKFPHKKISHRHNFRNFLSYIPEKLKEVYQDYF